MCFFFLAFLYIYKIFISNKIIFNDGTLLTTNYFLIVKKLNLLIYKKLFLSPLIIKKLAHFLYLPYRFCTRAFLFISSHMNNQIFAKK